MPKNWFRLHDDPMQEKILWSCVARNGTILVEAGDDPFDGAVSRTARGIFNKKSTPGWEYYTLQDKTLNAGTGSLYYERSQSFDGGSTTTEDAEDDDTASDDGSRQRSRRGSITTTGGPKLKAVKFHVYEQPKGDFDHLEPIIWVFAAVYNPEATTWESTPNSVLRDVKSFIQKIVGLTEMPRRYDDLWRTGEQLACQPSFSATLLQRMQEVTYLGEIARVVVDDDSVAQSEDAKALMQANITAILDREDKMRDMRSRSNNLVDTARKLQMKATRVVRRRLMMQRAKHGVIQGTLICAATAVVIAPTVLIVAL
ncbi:hypothetical protein ACA910_016370 [Epithemia clementina (nom. ined.)]